MSEEYTLVIIMLAVGTFAIRIGGYLLGSAIPSSGPWASALQALPGCMIAALLSIILVQAGPVEWLAAMLALVAALWLRNLPLTMFVGVGAVWLLRSMG